MKMNGKSFFFYFVLLLSVLLSNCDDSDNDEKDSTPVIIEKHLYGIWGTDDGIFFAVGSSGSIKKYNGNWTEQASGTAYDLYSVWGISENNIFAVGQSGTFLHYDGQEWSRIDIPIELKTKHLYGVWGNSENDIYLVGAGGRVFHYDGTVCTPIDFTTDTFYGIWGIPGGDIFIVGENGSIWKYSSDNQVWQPEVTGTAETLYAIFGTLEGREYCIFAVGAKGTILQYKNNSWISLNGGTQNTLRSVWCSSSHDVFCVGLSGTGIHFNGDEWNSIATGTSKNLYGIYGMKNSHIFMAGEKQDIVYHDLWDSFVEISLLPWQISQYEEYPVFMNFGQYSRILQFQLIWDDSLGADITLLANPKDYSTQRIQKISRQQKVLFTFEYVPVGAFSLKIRHKDSSLGHATSIQLKAYKYNHIPDSIQLSFLPGKPHDIELSPLIQKLSLSKFLWKMHSEYPVFSSVTEEIATIPVWQWILEDYTPVILEYPCKIQITKETKK